MTTSPHAPEALPKRCVCSGVRWCARCLDSGLRRAHGLHPPVLLPRWATERVVAGAAEVHGFDVAEQRVPGVPAFAGVHVFREFLSQAEADELLRSIERQPFAPAQSGKTKQHFGARVNFKRRRLATAEPTALPEYTAEIEARVAERCRDVAAPIRREFEGLHATDAFVLRYEPELCANLDFHIDDRFAYGDGILGVNLESDSVLTFLPAEAEDANLVGPIVRVPLPARSAVALCGPARNDWQHALLAPDIRARRTSVTLRTLGEGLAATSEGMRLRERVRAAI